MTRVSAERSRSSLATVDPPPPGIRTSTSATSGRWRSASSIASHASSAHPDQIERSLAADEVDQGLTHFGVVICDEHSNAIQRHLFATHVVTASAEPPWRDVRCETLSSTASACADRSRRPCDRRHEA